MSLFSSSTGLAAEALPEATEGVLTSALKTADGAESQGNKIDVNSHVSMNMWGITPEFFEILKTGFEKFLEKTESTDLKAEYLLPTMIGDLLNDGKLEVKVLQSHDQWFGVTYKEDKESVTAALRGLIEKGVYPSKLF